MTSPITTPAPPRAIAGIGGYLRGHVEPLNRRSIRSSDGSPPAPLNRTMLALVRLDQAAQENQSLTERIQAFITGNLKNRTTLKQLAHFLGYSEKYSSEFFQLQMGTSFSHYLKRVRIMKAKHMLAADGASITQIAEALGFSDCFAFSHFFKRAVGCSPTAFRKQQSALRV